MELSHAKQHKRVLELSPSLRVLKVIVVTESRRESVYHSNLGIHLSSVSFSKIL